LDYRLWRLPTLKNSISLINVHNENFKQTIKVILESINGDVYGLGKDPPHG
jgi:hypothetical protein